jgi:hypothetical protein
MEDKLLLVILALVLFAALLLTHQLAMQVGTPLFQKGIAYASWQYDAYDTPEASQSILLLKEINVKWVSLVVTWYQETTGSPIIYRDPDLTPDDEGVIQAIEQIHRLGMKVMLKPTVDVKDGAWRGEIEFESEEDWQAWFSSYRYFINYYAELAARHGVEEFSVGVELEGTTHREGQWRWIIDNVRARFKGPLVYAANWDEYQNIDFWDALDYAGIDAYFELAVGLSPKLEDLLTAWPPWVEELEAFYDRVRKPILFTEVGCRSMAGASARPWDWATSGEVDLQEQARYYEAAFRTFWDRPWFYGFYWWAWGPKLGGFGDDHAGYSPRSKPAEKILTEWYAKPLPRR